MMAVSKCKASEFFSWDNRQNEVCLPEWVLHEYDIEDLEPWEAIVYNQNGLSFITTKESMDQLFIYIWEDEGSGIVALWEDVIDYNEDPFTGVITLENHLGGTRVISRDKFEELYDTEEDLIDTWNWNSSFYRVRD